MEIGRVGYERLASGGADHVSVAFEDFLGGDLRGIIKQRRVIENGLKIFRDLEAMLAIV